MKKYKIAFVVKHFPSVSETFIMNQITDMIDRGHDIKIYSISKRVHNVVHDSIKKYSLIERTTYFKIPPKSNTKKIFSLIFFTLSHFAVLISQLKLSILNPSALRRAIHDHSLSLSLEKFLESRDFDIVHAHFGQRGAVIANLMAQGRIRKRKFVTSFHGYDLNPLFIERYRVEYKNLFQFADAVTVNSKYLESILLKVNPHPKNLVLLHEGLRTAQYSRKDSLAASHEFTIVFCGRLVEFKAPDLAVLIMDKLVNHRGHRHVKLRLIGEGKLRGKVEELIKKLSLKDNVTLLGALSQERVIEELNGASIFLLPGIHEKDTGRAETQGLVIQEAQAMELPVVVSDAGGMKYGLIDGVSGYVVKQRDIEAFADKIELLISNEHLRSTMGKAGRNFVAETFDTKILGDKLTQIYEGI